MDTVPGGMFVIFLFLLLVIGVIAWRRTKDLADCILG